MRACLENRGQDESSSVIKESGKDTALARLPHTNPLWDVHDPSEVEVRQVVGLDSRKPFSFSGVLVCCFSTQGCWLGPAFHVGHSHCARERKQ